MVVGHHPMYSNGKYHGGDKATRSTWEPLLKSCGVDVYLAGHEHHLEHFPGDIDHVISGAAGKPRAVQPEANRIGGSKYALGQAGFAVLTFTPSAMKGEFFHGLTGDSVYTWTKTLSSP